MVNPEVAEMALFCLPGISPIRCPNFPKNGAIRLSSKRLISKSICFEASRISICGPVNLECRSSLDSSGELEMGAPESAIIFIKASRISICGPVNLECRSSLDSSGELEMGAPESAIIFIKGLAQSTSEGVLQQTFSQVGEVSRVRVVTDKVTKQPVGFAYVWFTNEQHAQAAVDSMNGQFFEGRFIRVTIAKPGSCKPRPRSKPFKF